MCPHNKILEETRKKKNIPQHNKEQDNVTDNTTLRRKWATLPPKYRTVQILIG